MPSRLRIRVHSAEDLRSDHKIDAYVEVRHAEVASQRTKTVYNTTSPVFREDFRIELAKDKRLFDAPVEFKVWNYNSMTSDYIGAAIVNLHPLLRGTIRAIDGWFPVFDCLKGIRGWLRVVIRVDLIDNISQFCNTDFSVRVFSGDAPNRYHISRILGFVEELVVEDDPEFHWNKFRASRTTNDQRLMLMYHITGKVRRKLQLKVYELGGNAITRFRQHIDFEGEGGGGIVARAYGTCVLLTKKSEMGESKDSSIDGTQSFATAAEKFQVAPIVPGYEIPLITLKTLPIHIRYHVGGVVMARTVKLVKKEHRRKNHDKWWSSLRSEIFAHTKKLMCNMVLGYTEESVVIDNICVLTASGTACLVPEADEKRQKKKKKKKKPKRSACSASHVPYSDDNVPFPLRVQKCGVCKKKYVPEVVYATIDIPFELDVAGDAQLVQARVCMPKKKADGEAGAICVSEAIPFMEYDLHRELLAKLRKMNCNAIFGMQSYLSVGESMMTLSVSGTAVRLLGLPAPQSVLALPLLEEGLLDEDEESRASFTLEDSAFAYFGAAAGDEAGSRDSLVVRKTVDDGEADETIHLPPGLRIATVGKLPQVTEPHNTVMVIAQLFHERVSSRTPVDSKLLSTIICKALEILAFKLFNYLPCTVYGATFEVKHPGENDIQLLFTGTAVSDCPHGSHCEVVPTVDELSAPPTPTSHRLHSQSTEDLVFELDEEASSPDAHGGLRIQSQPRIMSEYSSMPAMSARQNLVSSASCAAISGFAGAPTAAMHDSHEGVPLHPLRDARMGQSLDGDLAEFSPGRAATHLALSRPTSPPKSGPQRKAIHSVMVSTLGYVPHARIRKYLGHLCIHMIKERLDRRLESDEIAYSFIHEAMASARSHVVAIGGNAFLSFRVETLAINDSTNYCVIGISGDAVIVNSKQVEVRSSTDSGDGQ